MAAPRLTMDAFLEKANKIHNNKYDYSSTIFNVSRDFSSIICPKHGAFTQRVSAHLDGQGCPECKRESMGNRLRSNKEKFVEEANTIHGNKYTYDKFVYVTDKIAGIIACKEHGIEFNQTPGRHKRTSGGGCPICAKNIFISKKRNSLEKTIALCHSKHGDKAFDYSKIPDGVHSHDTVTIKCNTCNTEFQQIMYSHSNIGNGCPTCRVSKNERRIGMLIENEWGLPIERSNRKLLDGLEIDVYIPSHKIGIEVHGNYWHSELVLKENKNYHLVKTQRAETQGIFLLQFFEDELHDNFEVCMSILKNKLGLSANKIHARKCEIREVDVDDKNRFLDDNHIQKRDHSRIKLGLYHENELVSLMTFAMPRYNRKIEWELTRFCNKIDTVVMGAADKLFQHFIKTYNPKSIISYADKRISQGKIYNTLGFDYTHDALPRYYYMHKSNYLKKFHRSNFTKDRIKQKYPEVDIVNNDEWTIMQSLNYDRIWDCGNKVYVWTKK